MYASVTLILMICDAQRRVQFHAKTETDSWMQLEGSLINLYPYILSACFAYGKISASVISYVYKNSTHT